MKKLRAWLSGQRISKQLSVLVIATVVSLCLFLLLAFYKTFSLLNQQWVDHACEISAQLESTVQTRFHSYSKIIHIISYNSAVQDFLLSENDSDQFGLYSAMLRNLSDFSNLDPEILDVIIVDSHGQTYRLSEDIVYSVPAIPEDDVSVHISPLRSLKVLGTESYYQVLSQNIYSIDSYVQTNKLIGTAHLVLSPSAFIADQISPNLGDAGRLYLTDCRQNIIWGTTPERATPLPAMHSTIYSHIRLIDSTNLSVALFLWPQNLSFASLDAKDLFIAAAMLILILLLILWLVWVRHLVTPLYRLSAFLENTSTKKLGMLSSRVELNGYYEIHSIGNEINAMLAKLDTLTQELVQQKSDLYESRLLAKQAELSHLRSQINPHFLYNTLETMVGIAYTESQPKIAELARALSLIFKYSIKGTDIVPFKDELKIAKNYILIQKTRFEGRFSDNYELDPCCLEDRVPKMILQPLIENAIVHGIEPASEFCHLTISAEHSDGDLVICIQDDGVGIAPQQLLELNERLSHPSTETSRHIGIANVHHRIYLMYGALYGVQVESVFGQGTRMMIRLPILPV